MDWKLFATTFGTVFLAEMGDKTQLATFGFAAKSSSKWIVFAASAMALVLTSAIAVLAGEAVARVVPQVWIQRAAGLLFVILGLIMLINAK